MGDIKVEHNPGRERLDGLGVADWPVWTKEVSSFPWTYDSNDTCYFLEGEVVVIPDGGQPVAMGKGDLVTFPKGMSCNWNIQKAVTKHYAFD
ncbi:MAG: cupin domain-containing protein [Thermodesulfobacteriota bacterium]